MAPSDSANMDSILHHITTSNNPVALNITIKNSLPKDTRDLILAGPTSGGQDPLTVLDVRQNSLGILYIITARLHTTNALPSWLTINEFCEHCDPEQLRVAPERVTLLAKQIVRYASNSNNPRLAIAGLHSLVSRYPPTPAYLTTIHFYFLLQCAATRSFASALPLLQKYQITDIGTALSPDLTYLDNLNYHYLAGVTLAALNKWALAEDYFEICITAPAHNATISAIQMEALKKLKLVQLIRTGSVSPLPKYTNSSLLRAFRNTPYHTLISHYPSQTDAMRVLMEKERNIFTNEKNLGLVTQALKRAPRWQVKKLTATYVTLSFADIGRQVGIASEDEVRDLVLSMIESGDIHATLSTTTVTFSDPPQQFTKTQVDKVLYDAQRDFQRLQILDMEIGKSKEFLSKAVKSQSDWSSGAMGGGDEDMFSHMGGSAFDEITFP